MASARSCSGRASARLPQVLQDLGQVVQVGGDVGVVRAVGRLGRWPAPVPAAAGPPPAAPGPAGSGPGCSGRGDVGVVRAVGRLIDGQRPF